MLRRIVSYVFVATAAVVVCWTIAHLILLKAASPDGDRLVTMVEVESGRFHAGWDLLFLVVLIATLLLAARRVIGVEARVVTTTTAALSSALVLTMPYYARWSLLGRLPDWLMTRGYVYDVMAYSGAMTAILVGVALLLGRPRAT